MALDTLSVTQIVQTATGVGTLVFMVFTAWRVGRVAVKLDDTHKLTAELVIHTNSLTDKLMEKTDAAAEARGVEKGVAQQIALAVDSSSSALVAATADAAAKVLADAAKAAAETLAMAVAAATRTVPEKSGG